MADELVKYAKRHGKLIITIVGAVFVMGGMFYTARADMDAIKDNHTEHAERLRALESEAISSHTKLDDIADDVRMIKAHLMGDH
jgi:uncharacterized protein YneF (UPF0154 family)